MNLSIASEVRRAFPELRIYYCEVRNNAVRTSFKAKNIPKNSFRLTESEYAELQSFRSKLSKDLFAVERLQKYKNEKQLPISDPITTEIIRLSYASRLPITSFCNDTFNNVTIRFSKPGETILVKDIPTLINDKSIVADTEKGLLGVMGIKSTRLGKIEKESKNIVILSFGYSDSMCRKSKSAVQVIGCMLNEESTENIIVKTSGHHEYH